MRGPGQKNFSSRSRLMLTLPELTINKETRECNPSWLADGWINKVEVGRTRAHRKTSRHKEKVNRGKQRARQKQDLQTSTDGMSQYCSNTVVHCSMRGRRGPVDAISVVSLHFPPFILPTISLASGLHVLPALPTVLHGRTVPSRRYSGNLSLCGVAAKPTHQMHCKTIDLHDLHETTVSFLEYPYSFVFRTRQIPLLSAAAHCLSAVLKRWREL